jgi:hypothetical protein
VADLELRSVEFACFFNMWVDSGGNVCLLNPTHQIGIVSIVSKLALLIN